MGVRYPSVGLTNQAAGAIVTNVETALITTPPLTLPLDFALVAIHWFFALLVGASTTALIIRIKRGATTAGAQINVNTSPQVTAGNTVTFSGVYLDTPGAVAGQQYTLTLQQIAGTANGVPVDACIFAYAL